MRPSTSSRNAANGRSDQARPGDRRGREPPERSAPERHAAGIRVQPERFEAAAEQRRGQAVAQLVGQRRDQHQRPGERPPEGHGIEDHSDQHADREEARARVSRSVIGGRRIIPAAARAETGPLFVAKRAQRIDAQRAPRRHQRRDA